MLFQMSEDFQAALESGTGAQVYGELLQSLELYAAAHFRFEEACMARYVCPVAAQNQQAHAAFTERIGQFRRRFDESGYRSEDAFGLTKFIDEWLANHICTIDVRLREFAPKP
jgi:hemerythrin